MTTLREIAHARSGDKGNKANVGLIADESKYYDVIDEQVTASRVERHFETMIDGPVEKYRLPNIHAFNFVLHGALGGGGQRSLRVDNTGKTFAGAILRLEIDLEDGGAQTE
jgi:hypothetical protein